jgi:alpha-glucosidase
MQWDAGPGAGFTSGTPWLPLAADYPSVNVEAQRDDPDSMLTLHRRLLGLRRRSPALVDDRYQPVQADGDVLAYVRAGGDER